MTHLTPSIKLAMTKILNVSGAGWSFIDEQGGICCGRPLMLAGKDKEARELINYNSRIFRESGAKILITSCPICYKVFRESYYLDIEILHHSQFIWGLIGDGRIKMNFLHRSAVYHTPCELGRGSGVYDEPRDVLRHVLQLEASGFDDENSLCCGGSLGNLKISDENRVKIAAEAAVRITVNRPDILATACPLCKKTFSRVTSTRVSDIAEIVAEALSEPDKNKSEKYSEMKEPVIAY
jgi:Fe-S oxidoreductase